MLTWPCGRQWRAAAHCAGQNPGNVARGRPRALRGWRSTGSCPSTGAAARLLGSKEGEWHHLSSLCPFQASCLGRDYGQENQGKWLSIAAASGNGEGWVLGGMQLTHNHDVVPVVMVTEVEVAASGSVALGHQRCVLGVPLQDTFCPHGQEAQHKQQEQPQAPQQLPAAQVWTPLGCPRQEQLEYSAGKSAWMGEGRPQEQAGPQPLSAAVLPPHLGRALPVKLEDYGAIHGGKAQQADPAQHDTSEHTGFKVQDEDLAGSE